MRIAIVHNFYSSRVPSGENQMVRQQFEALQQAGHIVALFSFYNDVYLKNNFDKTKAAFTTSTGFGRSPQKNIDSFRPDIIFVNNLFPNVGSRWIRKSRTPVVAILHNYRYFCATGLNFRENKHCFDCSEISPLEGLKNRCYRESFFATLPLTIAQLRREYLYNELEEFDYFVVLSEGSKSLLVNAGLASEKTIVIPNFIEDFTKNADPKSLVKNGKWICVGRISVDKGFLNLIENWPDSHPLDIVGDGPEMQELINKTKSKDNIRLLGHLDRESVLSILPEYSGAIHPSLWPEVCPLTVIEFLCAGLPIVTLESNTSAVTIVDNNCGVVLDKFTKDGLNLALESVDKNFETLSHNARSSYLKFFTLNAWSISINLFIDEVVRVPKEIKG